MPIKWLRLFQYFTLQIEVNNGCNLDCKICMRNKLKRPLRFLSFDDFKRVLGSCNCRFVGLHGWGEPLLNPQLFEMISYAESKGVSTNITTNGTLIGDKIDSVFESGLRKIAFGIYDKNLFLKKSLPYINELLKEKCKRSCILPETYLDITICKENLSQIKDLIMLAAELRINAVILHRLFNIHNIDPSIEYISQEEEDELFFELKQLSGILKLKIYLPPRHSLPCRIVKRSIFITVEGNITPCCFLPELYLGNVFEQDVENIMRSKAYREFIRNMKKHRVCGRCIW